MRSSPSCSFSSSTHDFSGSACEGYELKFRQISELDSMEQKDALSALTSTTWEDGAAKSFRFTSQNFLDQQPTDPTNWIIDTVAGDTASCLPPVATGSCSTT